MRLACFTLMALLAGCTSPPNALLAHTAIAAPATQPTVELVPTVSLLPEPPAAGEILRLAADGVQVEDAGGEAHALDVSVQSTWRNLLGAVKSGQRTLLPGVLPPYPTLPTDLVAAATASGTGRELGHGCISSSATGERFSEPVSMIVHGSPATLKTALRGKQWVEANSRSPWNYVKMAGSVITRLWNEEGAPVSAMYLDGKLELYALNKNSDYVLARDHMRVYVGEGDTLHLATTRDLAATVTFHHPQAGTTAWKPKLEAPSFGHRTDDDCDHERDLVMTDLLASGLVRDWAIVAGHLTSPANVKQLADGTWMVGHYHTDGRVYEVWLDAPTKP
ncbi:MAG: hypothetical protein JWM80_709 [Cyanobacteria bacterium RYN_339]|nr:hypothetical protein [Cyanobacteria bacterium RYN_339]